MLAPMFEAIVAGGGRQTQPYGCTAWACANRSEWNCPGRGCRCPFGFHSGVDVAAVWGSVLLAVGYGRVLQIGRLGGSCGGLGPYAVGILSGPVVIWYGHCSSALVRPGDLVSPGQAIARMGSLGCSTGTHTHFEVLPVGASSGCDSVDPTPYLSAWPGQPPASPPAPVPPAPPPGLAPPPSPALTWALLGAAGLAIAYGSRQ
jgi:murein DD-endopeptidase MepM/ murein hydrolase activator NlpD